MEEMKKYAVLVTYIDSMGSISKELYGPYDILDVDHVVAELMRMKLVNYWSYSEDEYVEEVEEYRVNGYWEDPEREWIIERVEMRSLEGYETI